MFSFFKYIDYKSISIAIGGFCLSMSGATLGISSAPIVSPIFAGIGIGAFGFYAIKFFSELSEKSKATNAELLAKNNHDATILRFGYENNFSNNCDAIIKITTLSSTFVNVLRAVFPENGPIKTASDIINPVAFSSAFCTISIFSNRLHKMTNSLLQRNISSNSSSISEPPSNFSNLQSDRMERSVLIQSDQKSTSIKTTSSTFREEIQSLQFVLPSKLPSTPGNT